MVDSNMHLDIGHFGIKVEFAQFHVEFFGIKFGANGAGKFHSNQAFDW